jgi:hypothetical protein
MKAIGIALGSGRLLAVLPGGRSLETTEVEDLARAMDDLKQAAALPEARVTVAVLPPLVELRRVVLPRLTPDEQRRIIARDVARYFVDARDAQVIGTDAPFAAAVPAQLIAAIESAVAHVGWTLRAIIPAHAAWVARAGDGQILARLPHASELLGVRDGRMVERSRVRGVELVGSATEIDPFLAAAQHAPRVHVNGMELLTEERRAHRKQRGRRLAAAFSAAAVVCLLLAVGLDYWGLHRELGAVRARRTAIAPQLARTMRARDSLTAATGIVATLRSLDEGRPSWSAFFTDLADYLPREAHVVAFRAVGDSVALVGIASQAAIAFQGLERMPRLAAVRADGAIRQDVTPSGVVREHFGVSARWSPR